MKAKLKNIKPSPKPVRSKWDEGAMEELKKSIAEQGLIVPIKVRPLDGKYEIVYGHRRVEAMRRLGWRECEAIVEGMDLSEAHIQAFIENVQREDLSPMDKARALKAMQETTGWTLRQMERRGIMDHGQSSVFLGMLTESRELTRDLEEPKVHGREISTTGSLGLRHVMEIQRAVEEPELKIAVAEKARREGLTAEQTRRVADAVKAAPDEATRKAVIETPIVKTPRQLVEEAEEAEIEAIVERLEVKEEEEKERAWWREHPSTKEAWKYLKMYRSLLDDVLESVEREKIPPEHCNFLANFLEKEMIPYLQGVVARLREKAKKW